MQALRLLEWQSDPVLVEVDDPVPGPGQVVVRVGGAGACHSDIHLMREFIEGVVPWQPPFTLGHENAGWVHAVGDGVEAVEIGQPVAVYGVWGCGRCNRCLVGNESYCDSPAEAPAPGGGGGLGADGGMAELFLVPSARHLVPLPDGLAPATAAPLTDAALTPYHAIRRSWPKLTPGSTAVVIGVGGLGHMGIQILKATTAAQVIAVDSRPESLAHAEQLGADVAVPAGDGAADAVRAVTGGHGADVVVDFVGVDATMALGAAVAKPLGDLTIVGIGGGTLPVSFFSLANEVSIQTTYYGSRPELVEVIALAAQGRIKPQVTTFPLEAAADAYALLEAGQIKGRAVVVPNPA